MIKNVRKEYIEKTLISVIQCDICKKEISENDVLSIDNVVCKIRWRAGYDSQHDGKDYSIDICDKCMNMLQDNDYDCVFFSEYDSEN